MLRALTPDSALPDRPVELASIVRLGSLAAAAVLVVGVLFAAFVVQHKGGSLLDDATETLVTVRFRPAFSEAERRYIQQTLAEKQFLDLGITSIAFPADNVVQIQTEETPDAHEWEQSLLSALRHAHEQAVVDVLRQHKQLAEEVSRISDTRERLSRVSDSSEDQMLVDFLALRLVETAAARDLIAARLERWRDFIPLSIEHKNIPVSQKILLLSHMLIMAVAATCVGFLVGYGRLLLRSRE